MGFYVVTKNGATILRRTYKVIYKIAYIVAQGHIRTRFFLHRSSFWWYFITKRKTIRCKQRGKPQGSSDPSKTCHSLILVTLCKFCTVLFNRNNTQKLRVANRKLSMLVFWAYLYSLHFLALKFSFYVGL